MVHRILVAGDEAIAGYDLCDTVEEAGYLVEGPYSGVSSASEAIENTAPDLAILDTTFDDGEVYDLAQKMEERDVPVIFYSSITLIDDVQARFPGATWISKPCPPADMLGAVNGALMRRRSGT
jgi:DNA-binding response OmpR family regulator